MKRSCGASSSSCSSSSPSPSPSCSSTSSSLEFQNPDQTEGRGRASNKRARRSNGNANGNGDGNNDDNKSKKVKPESSSSSAINGGRRSSVYRGVTRHRWTGRFEAHLWDKSCWNNLQNKKGRQVYLGAYDNEEAAARTYDLAALKYWGRDSTLNFPIEIYTKELEEMEKVTKEEYLTSLRRQSSGFSRGVSKYRGVARHHHNGRWEARIGRVLGNKYLYLGIYGTQEEAATAYDLAAIHYRGANAVTNFDTSRYIDKINLINQNNNVESQEDQTVITIPSHVEEEVEDEDVEEAPPNSSSELDAESENLQNQKQPPQQQLQNREIELENPQIQTNQVSPPNEESSPIAPVDPTTTTTTDEQELPWIFMDDDGFSHFQVPDMPDGDLLSVFGDGVRRFDDDDIGFLFRPDPEEADFNLDAILSSPSCYGDLATADSTRMVTGDDDCGGQEKLLCSANSASCSPNSLISYSDYTS